VTAAATAAGGGRQRQRLWCRVCGKRPQAVARVEFCFGCWPGGPVVPPPCLRCGSRTLYWGGGLCERCHPLASPPPDSCTDCLAWGATRSKGWLCRGCHSWRIANTSGVGSCRVCRHSAALNTDRVCRLCLKQAVLARTPHTPLAWDPGGRWGQQLFIADLFSYFACGTSPARTARGEDPVDGRPEAQGPPAFRQPALFSTRHTVRTCPGLQELTGRADPHLAAWVDQFTRRHAARCGWHDHLAWKVRTGVHAALGLLQVPGAVLTPSDLDFLATAPVPRTHVVTVLRAASLLEGDRIPAAVVRAEKRIASLPAPMAGELSTWLITMHEGRTAPPRRYPRSPITISGYLNSAMPALSGWAAAGKTSLREITPRDIRAALPLPGVARSRMGQGLRSVFAVLHDQRIVFMNPAAGIPTGARDATIPLPLRTEDIREALNSPDPAQAALCALIVFHTLTVQQLQHLQLTDLHEEGHLSLAGRRLPFAAPLQERLDAYLAHRRRTWPATANPHLFVTRATATGTSPASKMWITQRVGPRFTPSALRDDRLLDEAHHSGGDPKCLTDLFGLGIHAALRYTATVTHPALDAVVPKPLWWDGQPWVFSEVLTEDLASSARQTERGSTQEPAQDPVPRREGTDSHPR
jgi:site-specific recombinase XerC